MKLSGKTILITGGSSGIGLAFAKALLNKKNTVIICGRNADKLAKVKKEIPELETIQCDVADPVQAQQLYTTCVEKYPDVDVLINNAGIFKYYNFQKPNLKFEDLEHELAIDFVAPMRLIHLFLPHFLNKKEAAIVNVTSGLVFAPLSMAPVYCASKAGLHSYTLSLRNQLQETNVKIFEICPPLVDTPMVASLPEGGGFKKEKAEVIADALVKGMEGNKYEIRPKTANMLYKMGRLMPHGIVKQLNKGNKKLEFLYDN